MHIRRNTNRPNSTSPDQILEPSDTLLATITTTGMCNGYRKRQWKNLFQAMLLIEIANTEGQMMKYGFSEFAAQDLTWAAHDLIQHENSKGKSLLDAATVQLVALLKAADAIEQARK